MLDNKEIKEKILKLKKEKDVLIIAHSYQTKDVQEIADFVGDSYMLSKIARDSDKKTIVFCGVYFMAESAKILSPEKTIILPVIDAGCPMADMVTKEDVLELRRKHPDYTVVTYVNSSADVKSVSDICCTSSNAVQLVKNIDSDKIIFVPDKNLGSYVAKQVPEKDFIIYEGFCPIHNFVQEKEAIKAKELHPDALLLAHPECTELVLSHADFIGSTSQIIDYARNSDNEKFIIGTEQGILTILENENPDKTFYMLSPGLLCKNMKKTRVSDVLNALENMEYQIELDEETIKAAKSSLDRMLAGR